MDRKEAIEHCYEVANNSNTCKECKDQHLWLASQLTILENISNDINHLIELMINENLLDLKNEIVKLAKMVNN